MINLVMSKELILMVRDRDRCRGDPKRLIEEEMLRLPTPYAGLVDETVYPLDYIFVTGWLNVNPLTNKYCNPFYFKFTMQI